VVVKSGHWRAATVAAGVIAVVGYKPDRHGGR
jgi:hypothetical protein